MVAIAGGDVPDIEQVLRAVPVASGLAYVVVARHREAPRSRLPVEELGARAALAADRVYVVPPDREAVLADGALDPVEPASEVRAPADRLMRSLADQFGDDAIGIVLSGEGVDGAFGMKRIKEAGGLTLCQDPTQARIADMPSAAIATGRIDLVLPIEAIASELARLAGERGIDDTGDTALADIVAYVKLRTGHDFGVYKHELLARRIVRRMQVSHCATPAAYHQLLIDQSSELPKLVRELVVGETGFFRDPATFEALARHVVPQLVGKARPGECIRAWVPGCASGEEAYSIAMLLAERAQGSGLRIQVFATDIDDAALSLARAGQYPDSIAVDVAPARLARWFERRPGGYRVTKQLRDLVMFSSHDLVRDPPFSRLDLISCCNVLVSLEREAQHRVLAAFHFGLRPDGFLMLGRAEHADTPEPLFAAIGPDLPIHEPCPVASRYLAAALQALRGIVEPARAHATSHGELHHKLVEQYAPPSVLVDANLDILHLSAHAGQLLEIPGGEPSHNLIELLQPPLRLDVRTAVYAARQSPQGIAQRIARFDDGGKRRSMEIRARAVDGGIVLVLFDEIVVEDRARAPILIPTARAMEPFVRDLEDELQRARDEARAAASQTETTLAQLEQVQHELLATTEELRAATEELEMRDLEMRSLHEELATIDRELERKLEKLARADSELQNLVACVDRAIVFLDRELAIELYTPRACDVFHLIPSDVGRPLTDLAHRLAFDELGAAARGVLATRQPFDRNVQSRDGRDYLLRIVPYREASESGVILTLLDLTDLRLAEAARDHSDARFRLALSTAPIIATSQDRDLRYTWSYALGSELAAGEAPPVLAPRSALLDELRRAAIADGKSRHAEIELPVGGQARVFDVRVEPVAAGGVTTVAFDITPVKQVEVALREADRRKDELLATLMHELRNPLTPLRAALELQRLRPDAVAQTQLVMECHVDHLARIIDEMLDLSRVVTDDIALEASELDLRDVVDSALGTLRGKLEMRRLDVVLPDRRVGVHGDAFRMTQVVTNLLANALRSTPHGGRIRIAVEIDEARSRARIVVRDDGEGIAPDELPHVFDLLVRSRDATGRANAEGLGIGLALARRLVDLHGGTVTARSEGKGRGSELVVELPLREDRG